MFHATVVTLFPEMFPGTLGASIPGRALDKKIWMLDTVQIRDFAQDKHQTVDDTPFGGGQGMLMKADVVDAALTYSKNLSVLNRPIIHMSPRGKRLDQPLIRKHLDCYQDGVIILCGRYEGIDQRVIDYWQEEQILEEVSIGDYILSGGEVAAQVYLDALVRLLPGAVHSHESVIEESFEENLLEFYHYTRPVMWKDRSVPDVLLSGHHAKINEWRLKQSEQITKERRPDLWEKYLALPK